MSKTKMRCITCGKWFQSANAKEVTCPECVQKARKDKLAAKAAPPAAPKTPVQGISGSGNPIRSTSVSPKQKPVSSGTSHWFDSLDDVKVSEPDPPQRPKLPPSPATRDAPGAPGITSSRGTGTYHDERPQSSYRSPGSYRDRDERTPGPGGGYRSPGSYRDRDERTPGPGGGYRSPGSYRDMPLSGSIAGSSISQRPRQPMESGVPGGPNRAPRPAGPGGGERRGNRYPVGEKRGEKPVRPKQPKAAPSPKPKKPKIPPPEPFTPTPEQTTQVETRYMELVAAQGEFDGIRSQISLELSIPKKAVKQIVKTLREREHIPSWWESQTYKGDTEEKERILGAYQPHLPVPPVGVHRLIAEELNLKPGTVYQAIKTIRLELSLPQYNDPSFHVAEFEDIRRKAREVKEAREAAAKAAAENAPDSATAEATGEDAPAPVTTEAAAPDVEQASPIASETSEQVTAGSMEGQPGAE